MAASLAARSFATGRSSRRAELCPLHSVRWGNRPAQLVDS
jgi:hypothetical protein